MTTVFYILIFLAIWHFFYEGVIASALRHGLRYEFFKLRDELRRAKISNDLTKKDEQIYNILDNSICHMINSMSFISVGNYYMLKKRIHKNVEIRTNIEDTRKFIETGDNTELKRIDKEIGRIGAKALVINHGGWAIYLIILLPFVFAVNLFRAEVDRLTNLVTKVSTRLIYSSDTIGDSQIVAI